MPRRKEVDTLLTKLSDTADATASTNNVGSTCAHYILPDIDVAPFKRAKAYPGKDYVLMGNSFNLESEHCSSKRAVALTGMFEKGGCLSVADALAKDEFNQVLSRFERDWLHRLSEDNMLGHAYDQAGKLIAEAFAVWRPLKKIAPRARLLEKV